MKWHNEQIYRLIKNYTKPYRCRFVILMIAMLMKVLIDMSFSIMYGLIVDEIIYYRNMEAFFQLVFVTFILVFAYIFSSIIETGAFWNTQLRFVLDLRVGIMKSIYHAKARFLDHMKSGDVLRSVNLDTPEYMNVITDNIFETISTAAALLVTIVVSFSIDKYLPQDTFNYGKLYHVGIISCLAIIMHNIPEGILTYLTSTADFRLGITLALAIALHNIPEGISISVPIYYSTGSRKRALFYTFISGISEPFGAVLAALFLAPFVNATIMGILYAFIAGIMIHISIYELLNESCSYNKIFLTILSFIFGSIFMLFGHFMF